MKEIIPVLFYHTGNQEYLKTALKQCRKYNETVILLGDQSNEQMAKDTGCLWIAASKYDESKMWKRFEKSYVGMSTNDDRFELNCFRRFFVIHEFICDNSIDKFVYLDSDILTYVDFSSVEVLHTVDSGMSVPMEQSHYGWVANCGISLWNRKSVASFLNYCIDTYENHLDMLQEKWNYHVDNQIPGGICDMTLQYLWYKNEEICKKLNLVDTEENPQGVMDFNVNLATNCYKNEYCMNKLIQIKKLKFIDQVPFLISQKGAQVRVLAIHFLGPAKQYMKSYEEKNALAVSDYAVYYLKKLKAFMRKTVCKK